MGRTCKLETERPCPTHDTHNTFLPVPLITLANPLGALCLGQPQGVFVSGVWFGAGRVARLDESFSSLGLDEVDAESWDRRGAVLLVGFADAVGQSGNAGLLEVLVHEGVDNGVVKAVEEADGLDDGDDHVHRDAVVFVLQIVCNKRNNK